MKFKTNYLFAILLFLFVGGSAFAQSPANNATAVSATTNFTFAGATIEDHEVLQISVSSAFVTTVLNKDLGLTGATGYTFSAADLSGTLAGHTQLNNNTSYYWRILSADLSTVREPAGFYKFTTVLGPPTATAATGITSSTFSANWTANATGGATGYILRVGTTSGGTDIINDVNEGNVLTFTVTGLTASTQYYYSVKATDGTNITAGSNEITVTTTAGLAAPVANPATLVTTSGFTANWASSVGATSYKLRVGTTSGGTDIINDVNEGNVLTFPVTGLSANTHYYYSVKAYDGVNTSGSSNEISVTTLPAPLTLGLPIDGITGVSVLPTFTWTDVFDETTFTVKISTAGSSQAAFDAAVVATKVTAQNAVSYATLASDLGLPLSQGTLYYWQVSIQGGSSNGQKSAINHFTTTQAFTLNLNTPVGTVYTTPADFSWYLGTGAASGLNFTLQYKYDVAPPAGPEDEAYWTGPAVTTVTGISATNINSAVLYGKTYYWRVLAQNAITNDYMYYPLADVYSTFTTAGGTVLTIYPTWPIGGNIAYSNTPTLNWYLSQYSPGLVFQIRYSTVNTVDVNGMLNDPGAVSFPTDANILTATSNTNVTSPALTPGTLYYWQVRGYYDGTLTYSTWSAVESFIAAGVGTPVVPVASYPTSGLTVYTTNPTFYWYLNTASNGLYYDVDISTNANFTTHVAGYPFTTAVLDQTSLLVPGLTPGLTYYWRVRSNNLSQQSAWSESTPIVNATFTVAGGAIASVPVATSPIGEIIYNTRPTLHWFLEGSDLGISFVVKYKKGAAPVDWSTFNPVINDANGGVYNVSSSTFNLQIGTDLTYGGNYSWAVATYDGVNYTWSNGSFGIVGGSNGASVELTLPTDASTVYSTTQEFLWYINGPLLGLDHYSLTYSESDLHVPSTTISPIAVQNTTISSLTPGVTYYWSVTATYTDGSVFSSPWFSFTVNTGSPSIVMPIVGGPNHVQVATTEPMISWALPVPSVANTSYELMVSSSPNFSNAKTYTSTKTYTQVSGLNSGSNYYWKVRTLDGTGNTSSYSNMGQFKVKGITAVDNNKLTLPKSYSVSQNYPNPFNPSTSIHYALPKQSMVSIKVYNMLGQEVKTLISEQKAPGYYNVQWNGDNNSGQAVSSGIYIYRVVAGQFVQSMKMILLK